MKCTAAFGICFECAANLRQSRADAIIQVLACDRHNDRVLVEAVSGPASVHTLKGSILSEDRVSSGADSIHTIGDFYIHYTLTPADDLPITILEGHG